MWNNKVLRYVLSEQSVMLISRKLYPDQNLMKSLGRSRRLLFNAEMLGIENYKRQRALTAEKLAPVREKFLQRMNSYLDLSEKNTVFTDDLKTMLHIAETAEDLTLLEKMVKRYHSQSKDLGFSHFQYGPIIQRLYHLLGETDKAYKLFTTPVLRGVFEHTSTTVILMDNLFEVGKYEQVLEVMQTVIAREDPLTRYPVDCVLLYFAACLKMNSQESFEKVKSLIKMMLKDGQKEVSSRSAVYASILALNQKQPETALEMLSLSHMKTDRPPLVTSNVKVLVYLALNRLDEALNILQGFIQNDVPDHVQKGQEVFTDVFDKAKSQLSSCPSVQLKQKSEMVFKALEAHSHINPLTLDEYMFTPILQKRKYQDGFKKQRHQTFNNRQFGLRDHREKVNF